MKELIKKIEAAKTEIKNTKLKKEGRNTFSNYDYFTPSQIEFLVASACHNHGLLTTFDLIRNELGVYGELTVYDTETAQTLKIKMATAIPEIKATNIAQQLGGCVTYTERYLKMSFFGITDNQLDFDTTENTKKSNTVDTPPPATKPAAKQSTVTPPKPVVSEPDPDMIIATQEVKEAKDVPALQKVYERWTGYQKNQDFLKVMSERKNQLLKNA